MTVALNITLSLVNNEALSSLYAESVAVLNTFSLLNNTGAIVFNDVLTTS